VNPNVLQQTPEPQRTAPRGSSQKVERRSAVKGFHGLHLQLQHHIQATGGQHLPLPGQLPKVNHSLQNHLQLLQHGPHWKHSTTLQARMNQHFQEVELPVLKRQKLDSHASHFAKHFKPGHKPTPKELHEMQTFDAVWQGDPLSVAKSFGTRECQLCSREKINIVKWSRKEPEKLVNTCSEICGGCRHKPRFHRCREEVEDNSTDECTEHERVNLSGSNNSKTSGVVTPKKENQPSFCNTILQDSPRRRQPFSKTALTTTDVL